MRIIYIHQNFSTPEGSSGSRSFEMAKYLVERGHEVLMIYGKTFRGGSVLRRNGERGTLRGLYQGIELMELDVTFSNKQRNAIRFKSFIRFALMATKIVLSEKCDLLFATSTPLTVGIPGIVMKLVRPKLPFVFEVRDNWPEGLVAIGVKNPILIGFLNIIADWSINKADACVALSPGIAETMNARMKTKKRIELIPNGCDLEFFQPGEDDRSKLPGIKASDFVAIYTGAHGFANGLEGVLDAASILQSRSNCQHVKFVFIGDGSKKKLLVERAEFEKLANCVFLDSLPKQELKSILSAANVGLMVLRDIQEFYYGTSPNKYFDYISSGLPVFNNYPGWIADMIDMYKIGVAVPPNRPEEFANAIEYLAHHPEELRIMSVNARKLAEEQFSRRTLASKLCNTLEDVKNSELSSSR